MSGQLPEIKFWENPEAGLINPDLFSEVADKYAETIKESGIRARGKNKITQIRKFYDEVLLHHERIKGEEDFKKRLPFIRMLNAKAYYAEGRGLITQEFRNFIQQCLSQVKTKKDFEVFVKFFEAFMGFYRYYDEMRDAKKGGKHEA